MDKSMPSTPGVYSGSLISLPSSFGSSKTATLAYNTSRPFTFSSVVFSSTKPKSFVALPVKLSHKFATNLIVRATPLSTKPAFGSCTKSKTFLLPIILESWFNECPISLGNKKFPSPTNTNKNVNDVIGNTCPKEFFRFILKRTTSSTSSA